MKPAEFWDSTFEDAVIMYKAYVDRMRFYRNGFNLIHCSLVDTKNRVDALESMPLPFDEEIGKVSSGEMNDLVEGYHAFWEAEKKKVREN